VIVDRYNSYRKTVQTVMLKRFEGLTRSQIFKQYQTLKNLNQLSPSDAVDFKEAFEELEKALPEADRLAKQQLRQQAVDAYDEDFRNEYLQIIQDRSTPRMAGEAVGLLSDDDVIDFLIAFEKGAEPEKPLGSYGKVADKVNEYARLNQDLRDAGVKPSDLGMFEELDTGELRGGSPGPYIKTKKGKQTRVFMDRKFNEITGQKELVPFLDPDTNTPLSFTFGNQPELYNKYNSANEAIQLAALKLMGKPSVMNPNNRKMGKDGRPMYHHADFQQFDDDVTLNVEGMIRSVQGGYKNTVAVPSHTQIVPYAEVAGKDLPTKVRNLINDEMRRSGASAINATEALLDRGVLGVSDQEFRDGKLFRAANDRYGKEKYDQLIVSGYDKNAFDDYNFTQDTNAIAPRSIHIAKDLDLVRQYVEKFNPRFFTPKEINRGKTGKGAPRAKVQHAIPINAKMNGTRLFTDAVSENPRVAQIMDLSNMYV